MSLPVCSLLLLPVAEGSSGSSGYLEGRIAGKPAALLRNGDEPSEWVVQPL
jgi:hypothetical protein